MKQLTVALAVAVLLPLTLTQCATPYSQALANQVDRAQQLATLLKQVNDQSSADAAAPLVQSSRQEIIKAVRELCGTGEPSLLDLLVLRNKLKNQGTRTAATDLVSEYARLASANFYGSTSLRSAFRLR